MIQGQESDHHMERMRVQFRGKGYKEDVNMDLYMMNTGAFASLAFGRVSNHRSVSHL